MIKELEIRDKTVEAAIKKGLKKLGVNKEDVDVKILDEGRAGLFGLMGASPAKVKLTLKEKKEESVYDGSIQDRVKRELEVILEGMGIKGQIKTSMEEGRISAQIVSQECGLIIGKQGQTLDSLQHLINLIINKQEKRKIRVILDAEGYRLKREQSLVNIAKKIAGIVRESGRNKELEPMSSEERKIIHKTIKEESGVESFSKGEGIFRRVVITPKK